MAASNTEHTSSALAIPAAADACAKDRVEEIEAAINALPPEDFRRVAERFRDRDQLLWDQQLDSNSSGGKLDFLFEDSSKQELLRDWPSSE